MKSIIGVDISPKAVEQYNSLAAEHELSGKLRAITAELKAGTHLDAPIQQFDVVLVSGFLDPVHRRSTAAPGSVLDGVSPLRHTGGHVENPCVLCQTRRFALRD